MEGPPSPDESCRRRSRLAISHSMSGESASAPAASGAPPLTPSAGMALSAPPATLGAAAAETGVPLIAGSPEGGEKGVGGVGEKGVKGVAGVKGVTGVWTPSAFRRESKSGPS